jgi:hypothetical protein
LRRFSGQARGVPVAASSMLSIFSGPKCRASTTALVSPDSASRTSISPFPTATANNERRCPPGHGAVLELTPPKYGADGGDDGGDRDATTEVSPLITRRLARRGDAASTHGLGG